VDLLPAQQRVDEDLWYRGTADAVYQNQDIVASYRADYVIILAGDHVYKMNYAQMLADHIALGAECTVGCVEIPRSEAHAMGVMAIDKARKVTSFVEKPADPPTMPGKPDRSLASMGIYIFKTSFLFKELEREMADPASSHDFGKDLIPRLVRMGVVAAHPFELSCVGQRTGFDPYWRDVGTVDAYWDANVDLTATDPLFDVYDTRWPIWTHQQQLPPAKFVHNYGNRQGMALESLVASGCIVSGHIEQSMLFWSVRVHSFSNVSASVILPRTEIGRGARIHKAVIDRGVHIPEGMVIGEDPRADAQRFFRTSSGVTLVTEEMLRALE
jgi:glucose-1-phosphate adenylyltransferase